MKALDHLLQILRVPSHDLDVELTSLGLTLDDPLDAVVLRALARQREPLRITDLVAWVLQSGEAGDGADLPARVKARVKALRGRGYIAAGRLDEARLAEGLQGRFGQLAELPADPPGTTLKAPVLVLREALRALEASAGRDATLDVPRLLGDLGLPPDLPGVERIENALEVRGPSTRALLAWLAPALATDPLRPLVGFGVRRVQAHAQAVLHVEVAAVRALEASLLVWVADVADLLTPERLVAQPLRREELLRRFAFYLGVPVQDAETHPETRLASAWKLARLDYRRVLADEAERTLTAEMQAIQKKLLDEERDRRKAAAEAYASGRRE